MYLLQKLSRHLFLRRALRSSRHAPGIYLLGDRKPAYDCVLFDLSDPHFNHLGDQLFYQPLLHLLLQCGVPAVIAPTEAMKDYFSHLYGKDTVVEANRFALPGQRPLVVRSFWAHDSRQAPDSAGLLLTDLTDPEITLPLSGWLVAQITPLLGITNGIDTDIAPFLEEKLSGYPIPASLPQDRPVAVFNNYVDSGKFRVGSNHQKALAFCARQLRQDGLTIVHAGSAADKENDQVRYDFVDSDVRGKITPLELMAYFHRPNVTCSITFDNFIMHASLLANKFSHVRFRGRYTHAARQHHYLHVNQAFANVPGQNLIRYI